MGQGPHDWEHLCVRDCRGTRMSVAYFENKRGVYSLVGTIKQIRKVLADIFIYCLQHAIILLCASQQV